MSDWLKGLLTLGVLAALALGFVLLLQAFEGEEPAGLTPTIPPVAQEGPPPTEDTTFQSPLPTPTEWNWRPTATAIARITPTPPILPTATPFGGLTTPTPARGPAPPTMVPPKGFRAEHLEIADVRFVDPGARFQLYEWAPDGRRILVQSTHISYLLVGTGGETELGGTPFPQGIWSQLGDLWVMNVDGTERQKIADRVGSVAWSPDGKHVAFVAPVRQEGAEGAVYVADAQTLKTWKIADCDFTPWDSVFWLPGGELTYLYEGYIYAIQVDGTGVRQLSDVFVQPVGTTPGVVLGLYSVSPDGKRMAWVPGGTLDLWLVDLASSQKTLVTEKGYPTTAFASWSPDSRYLAFPVSNEPESPDRLPIGSDLWLVNADGSDPHPVAMAGYFAESLIQPTWSPDSQVIAFAHGTNAMNRSLGIVNRDGTGFRLLAKDRTGSISSPRWSPTGTQIGYTRRFWEPSGRPNVAIITLGQEP